MGSGWARSTGGFDGFGGVLKSYKNLLKKHSYAR